MSGEMITCVVCGKQYEVCKKCEISAKTFEPWRRTACCAEHWEIAQTINKWFYKELSLEEAKSRLIGVGVKTISSFTPEVKDAVDKIFKYEEFVDVPDKKHERRKSMITKAEI